MTTRHETNGTGSLPAAPSALRSLAELSTNPDLLRPPKEAIPRLAWPGYANMLAGREKLTGRSTFLRAAAAAKSRGRLFLGEPCTAGVVLMVWLEEHPRDLLRSMTALDADLTQVYYLPVLEAATCGERMHEIRRAAVAVAAEVIFIDSFARFVEGAGRDARLSSDMHEPAQALTDLARLTDSGVVFTHHSRKDGEDYRDSTAIGAAADVISMVTVPDAAGDESRRMVRVRGRLGATLRDYEYRWTGDDVELVGADVSPEVRVLEFVRATPGASKRAIREKVGGRGKTVDAAIEALERAHRIERRSGPRGGGFHALEPSKSLWDMNGHGPALGKTPASGSLTDSRNSLRDKGGHGRDTLRDTPDETECVPSPYKGNGDTHAPVSGADTVEGVIRATDGSESFTPERIREMRLARQLRLATAEEA